MSPYTTSSKSKTFPKGTEFEELIGFVSNQIDTETKEMPHHLGVDDFTETVHKYIITITMRKRYDNTT